MDKAAAILYLLSTPTRLHLMRLLAHRDHDVGWLAEQVGSTLPAVSQHLAKLRLAGLVSARRVGRQQIYTADDPLSPDAVDEHGGVNRDGDVEGSIRARRGRR
jgi:DNA-binding transcriptional ArsR family regulator